MKKQISIERVYHIDLNSEQKEPIPNLLTKELFYDEFGNLIKEITYNPPGIVDQTIESKYDDQDRMIEEICFDGDHELLEKTLFEWDAEGKKTKEEKHYLDGSFDITNFIYNSDANLIERIQRDDEGEVESKEVFIYQDKYLIEHLKYGENEELENKKTFSFKEGKLSAEIHWDIIEQIETRKEYRFTTDGNVEKELYYNSKGDLVKKTEYLKYNNHNVVEFMEEDAYHKNTTKLAYNENNNIILQEQINAAEEINHRIERIFDQDQRPIETLTFVNSRGQGVNLHFKEIHQYEYFN